MSMPITPITNTVRTRTSITHSPIYSSAKEQEKEEQKEKEKQNRLDYLHKLQKLEREQTHDINKLLITYTDAFESMEQTLSVLELMDDIVSIVYVPNPNEYVYAIRYCDIAHPESRFRPEIVVD
eukprot:412436_1